MKKITLFFITLITLTNVSYASFPVIHKTIVTTQTVGPELDHILNSILGGIAFFGILYFLLRTIWRGWKKKKKWVRMLPWAILIALIIALLFGILLQGSGMGG